MKKDIRSILNLTRLLYDFGQVTPDYGDLLPAPLIIPKSGGGADTLTTVGQKRLAGFSKVTSNYIESASFLKLREITLTYDLPTSLIQSVWQGARYAHISVSGRNLFTSTPYTGLDPEVSNFGNQPIARNIDVTPFPPSRSFWFAIDVGF